MVHYRATNAQRGGTRLPACGSVRYDVRTMPARSKRPQQRKRRLAPLDTAEGRREAEAAAKWYAEFNRRHGKNPASGITEAGQPTGPNGSRDGCDETMLLTRRLPGYAEALASARDALLLLLGRTPLVRAIYRQHETDGGETMGFITEAFLSLASYGDGSHGPALPRAVQWHEGEGSRPKFIRDLNARQANAVKKPFPNGWKAPWGDIPAVPLAVVRLWVSAGLWLVSSEDAAAVLHRQGLRPGRGAEEVPVTGEHIRRVVSDSPLIRYGGAGRLVFHDGGLSPDAVLLDELKAASQAAKPHD